VTVSCETIFDRKSSPSDIDAAMRDLALTCSRLLPEIELEARD
jgi:hypothetical protein